MKSHTSDFKNELKKMGRQFTDIVTYIQDEEEIQLQDELYSVTPHYEANLLKSVMKEIEIESKVEIEKNTIINYQLGILVNNNYEYLNFGNYIVYSIEKQEDTDLYKILCYDKMLYSMKPYESTGVIYPTTLRSYINSVCNKIGLSFTNNNSTFPNYNRTIATELYLDSQGNDIGYTFRDVLDEIAQATASTVIINSNDEIELKYITNTNDTIDEEFLKDVNVKFGEMYGPVNSIVLSRSGEADNVYRKDDQSIEQNGLTEIKIIDNQIMNGLDRADYLSDLYATLNGLEYSINDFSSTGILYYDICDRYTVQIGENQYSCVMFNDEIERKDGLQELIHTDMPEETETDYTKSDKDDRKINKTYLMVDKQNQIIQSVITNVSEQNDKISQITQTVDELNSKISDIADITTSMETMYATGEVEDINESEPITIKIHPNLVNISYYYPNTNLYPDLSLFMKTRTIRFHNTTTNEIFDYELPDDLLYLNQNVYDEFVWDYGDGTSRTCYINKKCGYNADGTVYQLATERIDQYTFPEFVLTDGDYTISLPGYNYGYIFVRLVASNIYTSQFATKAELNSTVIQKADEINATVSLKLDEEDFTHASIVLKINDDTSQAKIEADKINISANDVVDILAGNTINLTSKTISITSTNFSVSSDGTVTMKNADITGMFKSYSSNTGYLAVKIQNTKMSLYDYTNSGIWNGSIGSTYTQSTQQAGMSIWCRTGNEIAIGHGTSENSNIDVLMRFDTTNVNKTPWIKNTSTGSFFSGLSGGGVVVENGLIKSWNLSGIKDGTVGMGNGSITVTNGLITNWQSIHGATGTVRFKSYIDGWIAIVEIQNGIILSVTHERE